MNALPQHREAEALERFLGDPFDRKNSFSFARAVELDDRDAYPEEACARLAAWGFSRFFVPAEAGGRLRSYDELMALWRVVARRDLTTAVAEVISFISATPVWAAGTEDQRATTATILREGGQLAFALTERAHGSDLLAGEAAAERATDGSYVLRGEKWLIGNGGRSRALTLFTRTDAAGGPAGFSMLLVDKSTLAPGTCTPLPRELTMGLRGMDLSGLRFEGARVLASAVLEAPGHGLEVLLKAQQLARLAICALSLGGADTALRTTAHFAAERVLYGDRILALPYVRERLIGALLDVTIGECVLAACARGVHAATDQLGLWSAVAKCVIPPRIDQLVAELRLVLGARYHLRGGYADGIFQKVLRDHLILSVVEGSTAVNLKAIAAQLRGLSRHALGVAVGADEVARTARLEAVFRLDRALPAADLSGLALLTDRDDVVQGVPDALRRLREEAGRGGGVAGPALERICDLASALDEEIGALHRAVAEQPTRYGRAPRHQPQLAALAERYCLLHAAACCLHAWAWNRDVLDAYAAEGAWLVLCLERLLRALGRSMPAASEDFGERVLARLSEQLRAPCLFSLAAVNLAPAAAPEEAMP